MLREKTRKKLQSLFWGVNTFPILVVALFITLVALGISGSSVGIYGQMVGRGEGVDKNLITGEPRSIRSDEWIVTTQMIVSQAEAGFPRINENIGEGQNMNVVVDVPSKDWSQVFRPQNWGFFFLRIENAFAFKWWYHSLVLLLAVYAFTLFFLPKRHLLASLVSIFAVFSAFLQWWYGSTLSMLSYPIIISLLFFMFLNTKSVLEKIITSTAASYFLICFALMLYPPFQIPCLIVMIGLIIGYSIYKFSWIDFVPFLKNSWPYFIGILILVLSFVGAYIIDNKDAINKVQHTAYPGSRIVESGGYSITHLLSGSLAYQFQKDNRAPYYKNLKADATNQSESASFIFISLFLIAPVLYLYQSRGYSIKDKRSKYIFVSLFTVGLLFITWLYIPGMNILGKFTFLSLVPQNRAIIGLGLLNIIILILFMWVYSKSKNKIPVAKALIYSIATYIFTACIHLRIHFEQPGFIGVITSLLLALPVSMAIYFLLRKRFTIGLILIASFALFSNFNVNPLYKGLDVLISNPLRLEIKNENNGAGYWVAENIILENMALMAGKHSLTGVFTHPQLALWERIDQGKEEYRYNRYAHVSFNIDKDTSKTIATGFVDTGPDQLVIKTELCSEFMRISGVNRVVSSAIYTEDDQPCISSIKGVLVDNIEYYIYSLQF